MHNEGEGRDEHTSYRADSSISFYIALEQSRVIIRTFCPRRDVIRMEIDKELYKGKMIIVMNDCDSTSPREWSNLGTMVLRHRRYNLSNESEVDFDAFDSMSEVKKHLVKEYGPMFIYPVYMYDHSSISFSLTPFNDRWDSGCVGFIYVTKETVRNEYKVNKIGKNLTNKVKRLLSGELDTYASYINGDVYGYSIEDTDGIELDSLWGIYGYEECVSEARVSVDLMDMKVASFAA